MATSALRRAMIQVAGERDIGSQETVRMLLGKPLYSSTYLFLCLSRYNGDEHEDDNSDDDNDEGPHREEGPEEWMLLCLRNQRYDDTISQGSQSHENLQFDWTETARAMPLHLLRESDYWITKQRNDALENPTILNRRQPTNC